MELTIHMMSHNLIRQKLAVQALSLLEISVVNEKLVCRIADKISSQAVDKVELLMLAIDCEIDIAIAMLDMNIDTLLPKSQARAQYVNSHQRALLKTGLFRVLNKTLPRPMLDHNAIFRLDKPLVGGFSYMKMKGPVLDPDDDLITYLCIVNILGRLSDEEYSHATLHGIHLTMEEFMSPVRQLLSDNEKERFKQKRRWRTSLERLRDVSFVFSESELGARASWDDTNTFRAQESFLLVSLISGITWTRNDDLVITPSKELRELYRVSVGNGLAPLNPGLVMQQDGQFTRLLIMWIVGQGGNYNQRTGWFDLNKNIIVKELLSEVKFKAKYHQTDLLQLSFGLNELVQNGLLRYEIIKKNQKKASSNTISLSSIIQFKNHKLGDKQLDHKPDDNINLLKTTKDISVGEVTKIYRTLNFYIGGDVTMRQERLRNWDTKNRAVILEIMSRFKSVIDPKDLPFSLREARLLMTGLSSRQRYQLEEILQRNVSPDDFKLFQQILATDPRKKPSNQGKIETLLRQIQTLTQAGGPEKWLKQNNEKVESLIRELQNNQDSMKEFATLGKQLVTGRLITPLTKTGKIETAKLLSFFNVKNRENEQLFLQPVII